MVSQMSACPEKERKPDQGAHRMITLHGDMLIMEAPMKDDKNASSTQGKARRASYPKLPNEVARLESLYFRRKARMEEEPEEGRRKTAIWHIFEAW